MKRFAIVLVLLMAGIVTAGVFGYSGTPFNAAPAILRAAETSNSLIISDATDPNKAYEQLAARGDMGTLSASNRRTLILMPGVYTVLSKTWAIDTSYVDVMGLGTTESVVVTCSTDAVATVTQTANDVKFSNITFRHTQLATDSYAFLMSAPDNSESVYWKCDFRNASAAPYGTEPMYATTTLGGTWYYCNADDYSFRCALNIDMPATMYYCKAGRRSFMGDNNNSAAGTGKLSGYLVGCEAGIESFASCLNFGAEISGTLIDCIGGDRSFALGKPISGTLIRCIGGDYSFAGYIPGQTYYGSITATGLVQDCLAGYGGCFAMGNASSVQSGRIINCKSRYAPGNVSIASASTVTSSPVAASATTTLSTANSNITVTAKTAGTNPQLFLRYKRFGTTNSITTLYEAKGTVIRCSVKAAAIASEIKTLIEGDGTANALVAVAYPAGNDGTGALNLTASQEIDYKLTGGGDIPVFTGNCPAYPMTCIANTTVYPFDNGATYANGGDTDAIAFTLPAALVGYQYTFIDESNTDTADVTITASGAETIGSLGTSAVGNTDNTYGIITIKCVTAGSWVIIYSTGTWT